MSREFGNTRREMDSSKETYPSDSEETSVTRPSQAVALRRHSSMTHQNRGELLREKDRVWESLANKTLPPEESELIMRHLEKNADEHTRRSYIEGHATKDLIDAAITLSVGLTFLPGADKAQVARIEQSALTHGTPDQKSAMWRVNTAASLLKSFEISADLSLKEHDRTSNIAKEAKLQLENRGLITDSISASMQQLVLKNKSNEGVTIDSKHVVIVDDLRNGHFDMQATLIEVDGVSLLSLIFNCRYLISRTGVNMTFEEHRNLLDTMIEDARRLCVRSPVLFRMSTRARIINSKNTRYGIDQYDQFRTISTSQGIKEIISISASYFDALDPEGSNDKNQRYIKPRFLQMLVMLILFLNNDDLKDIGPILEKTYRIKAERADIEMLILKVVPLTSINPTVFLEALIPAVDGYNLQYPATEQRQPAFWDTFIQRISQRGYVLPGGIESLGRERNSWIVKWPSEGIKSTAIFEHLQYAGDKLRTINEITRVNLHPEDSFSELSVNLVDGNEYILDSRDIERITTMSQGTFTVTETKGMKRNLELAIEEYHVSAHLEQAISQVNELIDGFNRMQAGRKKKLSLSGRRSSTFNFLNNYDSLGRITKHVAFLDKEILTCAYKIEGRKIKKKDAWRKMAGTDRSLDRLLQDLERLLIEAKRMPGPESERLQAVRKTLLLAQKDRQYIEGEPDDSEEPIASIMYPAAETLGLQGLWYDYNATYNTAERLFHVGAKIAPVIAVTWPQPQVVEVSLEGHTAKYFARPLHEEFDAEDEIRIGDHAALVGHYLVLAERSDDPERSTFLMTNYLRITGFEETVRSRRGANRVRATSERKTISFE